MKRSQLIRRNMLKAACARTGKRRFDTAEAAQIALDTAEYWRQRGNAQRQEKRYYPCKSCEGFHLSSEPKRIPARSKKTAKVYRDQRVPLVAEMLADNPACAIQWDEQCAGVADTVHEIKSRARGGSILDPANLMPACAYCNGQVEDHPTEALARGVARNSWDKGETA